MGRSRGGQIFSSGYFLDHILAPRPFKMSSDKKVMKTNNLPFDEIYLERGLGFELQPQIGALEPKNTFLAFSPIHQIPYFHFRCFWG